MNTFAVKILRKTDLIEEDEEALKVRAPPRRLRCAAAARGG